MKSYDKDLCDIATITEETRGSLIRSTWPRIRARVQSQNIRAQFLYSEGDILHFITTSGTNRGHRWHRVQVQFKDFEKVQELYKTRPLMRRKRAMEMLLKGDIKVHCSCECWQYYCAYAATKYGYGIKPEKRASNIRNPKMEKLSCKHVIAVLYLIADSNAWFKELEAKGKFTKQFIIGHKKPTRI